ncbi:hypothetical protein Efla_006979 [Eimeria flavescens]
MLLIFQGSLQLVGGLATRNFNVVIGNAMHGRAIWFGVNAALKCCRAALVQTPCSRGSVEEIICEVRLPADAFRVISDVVLAGARGSGVYAVPRARDPRLTPGTCLCLIQLPLACRTSERAAGGAPPRTNRTSGSRASAPPSSSPATRPFHRSVALSARASPELTKLSAHAPTTGVPHLPVVRNCPLSSPRRRWSTSRTSPARTFLSRTLPATTRTAARASPRHPALPVPRAIFVPLALRPPARPVAAAIIADLLPGLLRATTLISLPRLPLVPSESQHGFHRHTPSSVVRAPHLVLLRPHSPSARPRSRSTPSRSSAPPRRHCGKYARRRDQALAQLPRLDELPKNCSELRRFLSAVEQACFRPGSRARPPILPLITFGPEALVLMYVEHVPPQITYETLNDAYLFIYLGNPPEAARIPQEREALWGAYTLPTSGAGRSLSPSPASAHQTAAVSPGAALGHSHHGTVLSGSCVHLPASTRHIHYYLPSGRPHNRHGNRPRPRDNPYSLVPPGP